MKQRQARGEKGPHEGNRKESKGGPQAPRGPSSLNHLQADPAAVVPLLPTTTAGDKSHGVLARGAPPHPRGQEKGPPGHLGHPAVRPAAPFTTDLVCQRALFNLGKLPLAHSAGRVLLPQLPELRTGHLLGRHPGKRQGGQGGAQEAFPKVLVFGVPQIGHLAAHAGLVFKQVGFVALVDVLLDGAGQFGRLGLIWGLGAEGGEKKLDTL